MSEDGKKYAANLARLLVEREQAIQLLEQVNRAIDAAIQFDSVEYLSTSSRDVDRFLTLVERP